MSSQAERHENLLSDCIDSLRLWKELIDTYLEDDEKQAETSELEEVVKEYCLIDFKATNSLEACQEVVDYFNRDSTGPDADVDAFYNVVLSKKESNFSGDPEQHKIWKEVFLGHRDVQEVLNKKVDNNTSYEEMQDSILCSNVVFTPPIDPISKKVVQEPYKNRKCGHIYEYKFIKQYIKSMKNKAKCPYMGCGNINIAVVDLVEDNEMKNKIQDYLESNAMSHD